MSWVITGSEKVTQDPFLYTNTVLLLKGDGTNGSTTILDSSKVAGAPKTVTAVGNAQISTAQSKFGGSSIAFDGNGDGLNVTKTADFDFGTANFTIESWVYFSSGDFKIIDAFKGYTLNTSGNYFDLFVNSSRYIRFATSVGDSFLALTATDQQMSINTWHHVAASKASGTVRLFVNGVQAATTGSLSSTINGGTVRINVGYTEEFNNNYLNGYIDDLRITKGIARYTANFTPPTAPFPDI
jgi:hypothetical protein